MSGRAAEDLTTGLETERQEVKENILGGGIGNEKAQSLEWTQKGLVFLFLFMAVERV